MCSSLTSLGVNVISFEENVFQLQKLSVLSFGLIDALVKMDLTYSPFHSNDTQCLLSL